MYISYSLPTHSYMAYHVDKSAKFTGDDLREHFHWLKEHLLAQAYDLDKLVADGWSCENRSDHIVCYNYSLDSVEAGIIRLQQLGIKPDEKKFDTHTMGYGC